MNQIANLVSTLSGIYLLAILLRFLFQVVKADFYNPVSQAVVQVTDPVVRIFRSFIPGYRGIDVSCLVVALVFEVLMYWVLSTMYGVAFTNIAAIILRCLGGIIFFILNIYFWAIIITIIMSFMVLFTGNSNPHPALHLAWQLTEPVLSPVRQILPPLGGLDFSPILVFFLIRFMQEFVIAGFDMTRYVALIVGP